MQAVYQGSGFAAAVLRRLPQLLRMTNKVCQTGSTGETCREHRGSKGATIRQVTAPHRKYCSSRRCGSAQRTVVMTPEPQCKIALLSWIINTSSSAMRSDDFFRSVQLALFTTTTLVCSRTHRIWLLLRTLEGQGSHSSTAGHTQWRRKGIRGTAGISGCGCDIGELSSHPPRLLCGQHLPHAGTQGRTVAPARASPHELYVDFCSVSSQSFHLKRNLCCR